MAAIAVVGAGMAGLTVARELSRAHDVAVFEKSRGLGGRMATRYADRFEFDHGAQYFTVKTPAFREFLQPLVDDGVVALWSPRFAELDRARIDKQRDWGDAYPHYVGAPRMNAVGRYLAAGLDVRLETTVARVAAKGAAWELFDAAQRRLGQYDWLVLAAPAPQSHALMPERSSLRQDVQAASMSGCFTLMLGFDAPLELPWQAAHVTGADISWISVNSSKPQRSNDFCLVVHSTNAWADAHMEDDRADVQRHLTAESSAVTGHPMDRATYARLHRWRFANIAWHAGSSFGLDADSRVAACGDWFIGGRVEAAYTSATSLVDALQEHL